VKGLPTVPGALRALVITGMAASSVWELAVTVNRVVPLTAPKVALIVLVPVPTPVANPPELIVAVPVVPEAQVTVAVRFWVLLSLKVPVATNCWVAPLAIDGFVGVTAIEFSVAAVTVNTVLPLTAPRVALIVLVPVPTPVAKPPELIVAVPVVPEAQVTVPVTFWVLLSL
jgi:hypothetical protein